MSADEVDAMEDNSRPSMERVPIRYQAQLHHQFLVTGASTIYFSGIKRKKDKETGKWQRTLRTVRIDFDEEVSAYVREKLLPAELRFWKCVQEKVEPHSDVDIRDANLGALIGSYHETQGIITALRSGAKEHEKGHLETLAKIRSDIEKHPAFCQKKMFWKDYQIETRPGAKRIDWRAAFEYIYSKVNAAKALEKKANVLEAIYEIPLKPELEEFTKQGTGSLKVKKEK